MSTKHMHKVTLNDGNKNVIWTHTFTMLKPDSLNDPAWADMGITPEMQNEQAFRSAKIDKCIWLRGFPTKELAEENSDAWQHGMTHGKDGVAKITDLSTLNLTEYQQAEMRTENPHVLFKF